MGGDLSWKRTALAMLVSMACAVVTYLIAVVKTRAITLADLQLIPKVKSSQKFCISDDITPKNPEFSMVF